VLDEAFFQNHIDRETLEAMMFAARDAFPDFPSLLRRKGEGARRRQAAWYDIAAPIGGDDREWSWDDAVAFVNEQFGTFSVRMRGLSERAFDQRWIDAEPRARQGSAAFCMGVRPGESRILANFTPSFDGSHARSRARHA